MSGGITSTEWLAELQRLSERSDEGLTTLEWAEQMGVGLNCARQRLRAAQLSGWVIVGKRSTTRLDGKPTLIPVYRIVKPKGGTK